MPRGTRTPVAVGLHFRLASATLDGWDRLYPRYVEQAELADSLGFSTLMVAEHHFQADGYIPAPYLVLAAFAARTRSVRLGAGVRPLPMIHPVRAAEDVAVLDNLSGGRAIAGGFGLGGRPREYDGFGIPFRERRSRYEESLDLVDRLLRGEEVDHAGRHFRLERVAVTPRPIQQPRPPLWMAAAAEPAVRRVARLADGWLSRPGESKDDLRRLRGILAEELGTAGRETADVRLIVRRDAWVAGSTEAAWAAVLPALHFHYTRDYSFIPDDMSIDDFRAWGATRFAIGDAQHLAAEIRWYRDEIGADEVILALDHPGLEPAEVLEATRTVGEEVLPLLTE